MTGSLAVGNTRVVSPSDDETMVFDWGAIEWLAESGATQGDRSTRWDPKRLIGASSSERPPAATTIFDGAPAFKQAATWVVGDTAP